MRLLPDASAAMVVLGLIACVPLPLSVEAVRRRSPWPRRFLGCGAAGAPGCASGPRARRSRDHVLFVSNHVSWLDILALGGATGAIFVSRDDVEGWPVVGWLAGLNDTIFVARQARREVHGQADRLRRALAAGRAVALFPGGNDRGRPRGPALPAEPVRLALPAARRREGPAGRDRLWRCAREEIAWVGDEPAGANAKRVLSRTGTIPVVLRFLAPVDPHEAGDRKALAAAVAGAEAIVRQRSAASEPGADRPIWPRDEEPRSQDLPRQVVRLPDERL